ncbi:MAG TPA: hypothetical protein VMU59_07925, partial [Caulobacteraceae bacterium]|nr:hypothetical protein [Caulobacteraceae bacterium]
DIVVTPPNTKGLVSPASRRLELRAMKLPGQKPELPKGLGPVEAAFVNLSAFDFTYEALGISPENITDYNLALEEYHQKYSVYYDQMVRYADEFVRVASLPFLVFNRGTAVATSFRAKIVLPDELELLDPHEGIGKPPTAPKPPEKPGPFWMGSYMSPFLDPSLGRGFHGVPSIHPYREKAPLLNRDAGEVELRLRKLVQHDSLAFDQVNVLVSTAMTGSGGHLEAIITAEELPRPVSCKLAFRIRRG